MSDMAVHYSTGKDDWETPPAFFAALDEEFRFDMDVCASGDNAKCANFLCVLDDGLRCSWVGYTCWCNPPYSQLAKWLQKASEEAKKGATVVMLIPARTDTKAWHQYVWDADRNTYRPGVEVRYVKGRLKFVGAKNSAPFPSAVVIFGPL